MELSSCILTLLRRSSGTDLSCNKTLQLMIQGYTWFLLTGRSLGVEVRRDGVCPTKEGGGEGGGARVAAAA